MSTAAQTNITSVGTIAAGTWQGTEVGLAYGGTELVGETDGKIVIADGAGAPVHLDVGSSTAITILGTVATGVWQGTDVGVAHGGTGLSAAAKGSVLIANAADTISALDGGGSNDGLLYYTASADTIAWATSLDGGTF